MWWPRRMGRSGGIAEDVRVLVGFSLLNDSREFNASYGSFTYNVAQKWLSLSEISID